MLSHPNPKHWGKIRAKRLKQAKNRCELCNAPGILHCHHRTYERFGKEKVTDVLILCGSCHGKVTQATPGLRRVHPATKKKKAKKQNLFDYNNCPPEQRGIPKYQYLCKT
jgi:5-methylcytosine-specific restriction endonuclease McrA